MISGSKNIKRSKKGWDFSRVSSFCWSEGARSEIGVAVTGDSGKLVEKKCRGTNFRKKRGRNNDLESILMQIRKSFEILYEI
jgi:hypothetical protein